MGKTVLHQLKTESRCLDGMSYVVGCDDGSIVVIDGAMYEDGDELYRYLREISGGKDPIVDAWFITHAHPDHTDGAKAVAEKYADGITVKKLIYQFPDEAFNLVKEPNCIKQIEDFRAAVKVFGAEHIVPKTGDVFCFGKTKFEVLFTYEDLPRDGEERANQKFNDSSTVIRLSAEGQRVLFLGDVQEAADRVMKKRYGKELKSEVCQVAHHGWFSSTASFYDLVEPEILLWPCCERAFYNDVQEICASRHLVCEMDIKDIYLAGHGTVALELPIKARKEPFLPEFEKLPEIKGKKELEIPYAEIIPDINDPLGESWSGCEFKEIAEPFFGEKAPFKAFYKAFWRDDRLYLNVRMDKPLVSRPNQTSSTQSDTVRICLTDRIITDRNLTWKDVEEKEGNFANLKIYGEEKIFSGEKITNLGGGENCVSSYLVEDDRFFLTACVKMASCHKKGDLVGFNLEVAGLPSPEASRSCKTVLVFDTHGCDYWTPAALIFAELI